MVLCANLPLVEPAATILHDITCKIPWSAVTNRQVRWNAGYLTPKPGY